jgi:phosphatidylinositol-3,4,5-trisphosphate 3-phosphatase/dual-specificity protein phosphatase PTEN
MALDYVRQVVSGNKARFVDRENAVDLDLVYGTWFC